MPSVTYDSIAANVAETRVEGARVDVTWKCAASGRTVGTSSATMAADPSLAGRVGASVKRSLASELIYGAARMVSSLVGGAAGRVISSAAYTAAGELNSRATAGAEYTEASRRAAVVAAFASVEAAFAWDATQQRFIAR